MQTSKSYPFKHQPQKMVKHAQTSLSVFDHFVGLALSGLRGGFSFAHCFDHQLYSVYQTTSGSENETNNETKIIDLCSFEFTYGYISKAENFLSVENLIL